MSELSKLQKRVKELGEISGSSDSDSSSSSSSMLISDSIIDNDNTTIFNFGLYDNVCKELASNEGILNEIDTVLLHKINKLIHKADEKDIITGQPRYGNEKKKVIIQLKDDLLKLQSSYQQSLPIITQKHQHLLIQKEQHQQQQQLLLLQQQEYEKQQQQLLLSSNDNDNNNTNNDNEETLRLAKLAELRREQKAKEKNEKKMKRESLQSLLKDIVESYGYSNTTSNNNDNILKVYNNIKANNDNDKSKKMILMVTQLLDNISGHPDDENLRKLRITNASLQDKLTGHPGGIELLISIGFTPKIEDNDDDNDATTTTTTTTSNVKNILLLSLCHDTNCNVILDMIEPNPAIDANVWLAWYDGLKANKEYLEKLSKTSK